MSDHACSDHDIRRGNTTLIENKFRERRLKTLLKIKLDAEEETLPEHGRLRGKITPQKKLCEHHRWPAAPPHDTSLQAQTSTRGMKSTIYMRVI